MKFSKRDREMAAVRCQVIADYWSRCWSSQPDAYDFQPSSGSVALSEAAYDVANAAYPSLDSGTSITHIWAEAEALIRTGWEP